MDRNLAAHYPEHADRHQMEKVGDALMKPVAPVVPLAGPRSGPREAFLGLAGELREEANADAEKHDEFMRGAW